MSLEKRNFENKCITKIKVEGNCISDQDNILREIKHYYENLYKEESDICPEIQKVFLQGEFPRLTNEVAANCEGILTDKECTNALKKLNFGKTPGSDGLNIEFYSFFWTEIKNLVLDSLNFALIKGELSIDQKRGVITLTPKKDKDSLELKNWSPISVLNTDYKILTKCLALRLQTVLSFIIHPDQSGYIKNRNIVDNLRLLIDIPTYCKRQKISGILFSIDFEKAFDSLNFSFLIRVLEAFNFGVEFIS